jgi:Glycosyl hydrolases family 16
VAGADGSTSGLWPAFWFQNAEPSLDSNNAELDLFEGYSVDQFESLHTTWHLCGPNGQVAALGFAYDSTGNGCECGSWTPPVGTPSFATGWHTIGVLITSAYITLYLDGKQIWQTPNPDDNCFGRALFPMLQAALGGYWPFDLSFNVAGYPTTCGPGGYWIKWAWVRGWGNPAEQ